MFLSMFLFNPPRQPLVVSYGMGVDSTAMLMALCVRGIRPDAVLFADTKGEKRETMAYQPVIERWLAENHFPPLTVVCYKPADFKNYPPYDGLETNCLTNGTLPSLAFGFKSCSLKWKVAPQDRWLRSWPPARACWTRGGRVRKAIGYDASPGDIRRRNHAGNQDDPYYEYWYPLQEWGWTRERCLEEIIAEQRPGWDPIYVKGGPLRWIGKGGIPVKSSCFFCPAMKPDEVDRLPKDMLRRIVVMEARAKPNLKIVEGLWRKSTTKRPGSMTEYIRKRSLLSSDEIDRLVEEVPKEIVSTQEAYASGERISTWEEFFEDLGCPM